ncbi:MAG: stage II sporulation protein P [Clostridia bacterium]|nr:stage II sporulation protein P [Clostridia bacterium]
MRRRRNKRFKSHVVAVQAAKPKLLIIFVFLSILLLVFTQRIANHITLNSDFLLKCIHQSVVLFEETEKRELHYSPYDFLAKSVLSIRGSDVMSKKYAAKYGGILKKQAEKHESEKQSIVESDISAKNITFINTPKVTVDAEALLNTPLSFAKPDENPKVLIMHTHTSEAYCESEGARNENQELNVVGVGKEIAEALESQGISVIHDVTQNDNPSYNQSYKKALTVIERNVAEHPSIEVVLDIHRDYIKRDDGTLVKPTVTLKNGSKAAQIMFVIGTDSMGLHHPQWRHNLAFAVKIQHQLNLMQPGLCRSINIRTERFNQHVTKGSMIIEIGTAANTAEEAKNTSELLATAIAAVLQ